jgi:hypothetical protein
MKTSHKPLKIGKLIFALALIGPVVALAPAACKTNAPTAAAVAETSAAPAEGIDLAAVTEVLGKPGLDSPGVYNLVKGDTEYWIVYQFFTRESKDIDDDIGRDLGPKIQALYEKFKALDRVHFVVDVYYADSSTAWQPYCSFAMTRKVFNETDWTNLLSDDLFKVVLDLKYAGS